MLTYIRERNLRNITYIGADRSAVALAHARAKFPDTTFVEIDVNSRGADLDRLSCDYLVANGTFTLKFERTYDQMWSYLVSTIERVWPKIRRGIAFNVMSKVVDRERDDLFHLPMDEAARLLHKLAGRRVRLRADYGLDEYTAYAYKPESPEVVPGAPSGRAGEGVLPLRPLLRRDNRLRDDCGLDEHTAYAYNSQSSDALPPVAAFGRAGEGVPPLRPLLPGVDRLVPYLRRIDAARNLHQPRSPFGRT